MNVFVNHKKWSCKGMILATPCTKIHNYEHKKFKSIVVTDDDGIAIVGCVQKRESC